MLDTSFAGLLRLVFSPDMNAAASIPQHLQKLPTGCEIDTAHHGGRD